MSCGTAARLGFARSPRSSPHNSQFYVNIFRNKRRIHLPQPQHNSRRTAAAATAAMRRGWRWRWRLRRQRCGIATVVDKISTEYDITQQQRTRSHRRERVSAGLLAPTTEVAGTRHASPATLWCLRIKVGLCLPPPSTAHIEQCLLCAAVWVVPLVPSDCCAVVPGGQRC